MSNLFISTALALALALPLGAATVRSPRAPQRPVNLNTATVTWNNFDIASNSTTGMVGGSISISSGIHIIRQRDGIPFGAYVYGYSTSLSCIYAYPAGLCLNKPVH